VGKGCSSFTIAAGRAYTVGNRDETDTLWCLDAKTGEILWKKTYSEKLAPKFYDGGPGATPIVEEGLVYNLSKSGRLSCYDAQSGDEKWVTEFKDDLSGNMPTWGFSSSPVVYGDVLLCLPCSKKGALVALNKKTGKLLSGVRQMLLDPATPHLFSTNIKAKMQQSFFMVALSWATIFQVRVKSSFSMVGGLPMM